MYCAAKINRHHHAKYKRQLQQLHLSKVVIQRKIRQHQGIMGYPFQKLHSIAARRHNIMWGIEHHTRLIPALEHIHYNWD